VRLDRRVATGAIIIGGDYRGLGVARSLGRHGVPAWVVHDDHLVATFSRYVQRSVKWPTGGEREQIELLCWLAGEQGLAGWTLFPTGDETAALVARTYDVLSARFRLTTPPWNVLRYAYDKRLTYQRAAELGIDHPRTIASPLRPEWERGAGGEGISFPVILKPAWKATLNAFTRAKAWKVEDWATLDVAYREAADLVPAETIVIQELIPGGGDRQFSYAALASDGRPVVEVTARRVRQYPPDFGYFSTFVESIDCPEVEEPSRRFLESLRFTGLVELEYKFDARDRTFKLLDVNPRVWGWHTLGRRVGGDFPYLAWKLSQGSCVEQGRVPAGHRWVYAGADALAGVKMMRDKQMSIGGYLRSIRPGAEDAVFAMDDPLPGILDMPLALQRRGRKVETASASRT